MESVTITGLERTLFHERTDKGHLILAYFKAQVGVFTLKGCALTHTSDGETAVWLPNLSDKRARQHRSIELRDRETRAALKREALEVYARMGGEIPELPEEARRAEPRGSIERAEVALANILPPPVIRREIPVTVTRRTKEQVE